MLKTRSCNRTTFNGKYGRRW